MNLNDNQQENMTWEQTLARHNQIMSDFNKQRELEETLKKESFIPIRYKTESG